MEGTIELENFKPQIDAIQVLHRPGKEREEHNHGWDVQVRESGEGEVSGRVSAQDLDNPHLPPVDQVRKAAVGLFIFRHSNVCDRDGRLGPSVSVLASSKLSFGVGITPTECFKVCLYQLILSCLYPIFRLDYYTSHPPLNTSSAAAVSVIGTASLGIQYIEIVLVMTGM